ncbi:MAG: SPOR domain-containing protein [Chlorobiales bacterium]|nr:SPOR domain-containing protein [Chlorobiales bacterium]
MFYDQSIYLIRQRTAYLSLALSVTLFSPSMLHAADEQSYAQEIQQDVAEGKVYLLENIRQKVTIPSEKTVLEALFTEDGPQAIALYRKQLREYPDPVLNKLSNSRIDAYTLALNNTAPTLTKRSLPIHAPKRQPLIVIADSTKHASKPRLHASRSSVLKEDSTKQSVKPRSIAPPPPRPSAEASKEDTTAAGPTTFTLQFGSFENRKNAETLAKEISRFVPVEIVQKGGIYKVQLKKHYTSNEDVSDAAIKLPFKTIIIQSE